MLNRIKELRNKNNLTLRALGQKVNMSSSRLSQYETGKREPKLETWQKLADFFNVPVDYLLGISKDRSTLTIDDLNPEEQDAYERITDLLSQEYPQTRPEFNWSKIGQLLINSDLTEEQFFYTFLVFFYQNVLHFVQIVVLYIQKLIKRKEKEK